MKAVLVLDEMPKECDECPMYDFGWGEYCMATGKSVKAEGKEPWCPLKEMPTLTDTERKCFDESWIKGFDYVIEEIERNESDPNS